MFPMIPAINIRSMMILAVAGEWKSRIGQFIESNIYFLVHVCVFEHLVSNSFIYL